MSCFPIVYVVWELLMAYFEVVYLLFAVAEHNLLLKLLSHFVITTCTSPFTWTQTRTYVSSYHLVLCLEMYLLLKCNMCLFDLRI